MKIKKNIGFPLFMPVKDLTGQKFGRLTVIEFAGFKNYGEKRKSVWRCKCSCEKQKEISVVGSYLTCGETKSCGCICLPGTNENMEILKNRMMDSLKKQENGCWIWNGYLCEPRKIYGLTSSNLDGKKKKILSHRLSYRLWKGEIPLGMYVLHSCDTPLCCNPDHLHLGTARENMNEMKSRGREKKVMGEKNHKSKLTEEKVKEIRNLYESGYTHRQIKQLFGIGISTIHYIITRKTWRNI